MQKEEEEVVVVEVEVEDEEEMNKERAIATYSSTRKITKFVLIKVA